MTSGTYNSGRPYIGLVNRQAGYRPHVLHRAECALSWTPTLTWPDLWAIADQRLKHHGYTKTTRLLYRQVLRLFSRHVGHAPYRITTQILKHYIHDLAESGSTWSWIASNISVLRTIFDKIACRHLTGQLVTPKRKQTLPEILSQKEVNRLLNAAGTIRDQLLLGLLYGCGLKVGELCRLKWGDLDMENKRLCVPAGRQTQARSLALPPALYPVLEEGVRLCPASSAIFPGRIEGKPLSTRAVELIVRRAAEAAVLTKTVCAMTLRHSYAVHRLESGESIRAVQEALGHRSIKTTLRYQRCMLPRGITDPLAQVRALYPDAKPRSVSPVELPAAAQPPQRGIALDHASLLAGLELPFRNAEPPGTTQRIKAFFQKLGTQISGRFLASTRSHSPPD